MENTMDGGDGPIGLRICVYRRTGEFSVTPATFPKLERKTKRNLQRKFDDANAHQKRMRA